MFMLINLIAFNSKVDLFLFAEIKFNFYYSM